VNKKQVRNPQHRQGCAQSSSTDSLHPLSELAATLCMIIDSAAWIASDDPVIVTFLHQQETNGDL
jgi:hypothetical protein